MVTPNSKTLLQTNMTIITGSKLSVNETSIDDFETKVC